MHEFILKAHKKAHRDPRKIVFPEGEEDRILRAVSIVQRKNIAIPILLGNKKIISQKIKKYGIKIDLKKIEIHDPNISDLKDNYAQSLHKLRKDKGLTLAAAKNLLQDINYFGTMMVECGDAEGMVTGTTFPTDDSIRPALQIIKTHQKFHKVSGVFFMILKNKVLLFADSAIMVNPNSHDLVDIAEDTASTARKFGLKPKIAFLSFSTKGSADHPEVDKVKEAVAMMKNKHPNLLIDGELQVDAAIIPKVAAKKCPESPLKGNANILIFPNLEAANISYKLVERLAGAEAIGPFLQGLKKPVNDLSRGCDVQDIVNVTAFTVCECQTINQ